MADSSSELHLEIETLERKHAENPEGRFFVPLANAYRKMGDVETAEALLRGGIERHPDYLSAHIVLGRCLADRDAIAEAEEEFRYVLSRDPQNLIALRTLGELAAGDGRPREAAEWYRELLSVDPMNEEARQALDTLGSAPDQSPEPSTVEIESAEEAPEDAADVEWRADEPEDDPADDGAFTLSAPEVVTETIAELYTRQGLHDRAAEVYRELIRRRGGDAALEARLTEVERLARGELIPEEGGELVLTDEEALRTPPLDADTAEDGSAVSAAGDGDGGEVYAPAQAFGTEEVAEDPFAASVADGFASLELEGDEVVAPDEPEAPAPATRDGAAGGTIGDLLGSIARWRPDAAAVLDDLSFLAPDDAAAGSPGTAPADDEPFPWEVDGAEAVQTSSGAAEESASEVEPLFGESVPEWREPVAESNPETVVAGEVTVEEDRTAPVGEPVEDEDLESFQAWLRSLKR